MELATPPWTKVGLVATWGPGHTHLPQSLLGCFAGSHLLASGAPGPLVCAFWGPVILAWEGERLGCKPLGGATPWPCGPLLPACQTLPPPWEPVSTGSRV